MGICSPQDEEMNKYIVMYLSMISLGTYAFFNMPQQMMSTGSQMMFPAQDVTKAQPQTLVCDCNCNKQEKIMLRYEMPKAPAKKAPAKQSKKKKAKQLI